MGGSPKRGVLTGGGLSRGRVVLLTVLAVQLLLVVGLMKAPRMIFLGASRPFSGGGSGLQSGDQGADDEEAVPGSWLWRRFVVERAFVGNCSDGNGGVDKVDRECRNHSRVEVRWVNSERAKDFRRLNASRGGARNVSHGASEESRKRRQGLLLPTVRDPKVDRIGSSSGEHTLRERQRRVGVHNIASGSGSPISSRRRGYSTDLRSGERLLEKDNLRVRRGRGGYMSVSGGAKERAQNVDNHVSNVSISSNTVPASSIRASEERGAAISRSEVSFGGRRTHYGALAGHNAHRRNASLDISNVNSTNVKRLEPRDIIEGINASDASGDIMAAMSRNATCLHGNIYVYTLPKKFNHELLENCSRLLQWGDRCRELSNSGLGPSLTQSPLLQKQETRRGGPWYGTDQFNGEVIFHNRLLTHPCRTHNPETATAFYIPYYAGLDVARFLFNITNKRFTSADRDKLGSELAQWLRRSPYWKRHQGQDHFLVLGRITWDFRRKGSHGWGSGFIHMAEMANVTKLALERDPWDATEMGVPYPTGFHPRTDSEVTQWQHSLRKLNRELLFSFAGGARKQFPTDFRLTLFEQCARAASCEILDCSGRRCEDDSEATTKLFMRSTFCLQPRGDSFTRRSIFDSLVAGCIPVFFWTKSAYLQYNWHLPSDHTSYSVFIPQTDIRNGAQIEHILRKISPAKVQQMQETIREMVPRLVYAGPQHELVEFKDAFDTTIDKVLASFELRANQSLSSVIKQALPAQVTKQEIYKVQ